MPRPKKEEGMVKVKRVQGQKVSRPESFKFFLDNIEAYHKMRAYEVVEVPEEIADEIVGVRRTDYVKPVVEPIIDEGE